MSQYIATDTKSILTRYENALRWGGMSFPGLYDPQADVMYDHPEDSRNKSKGVPTALEKGLIILVHGEVSDVQIKKVKTVVMDIYEVIVHLPSRLKPVEITATFSCTA